MNIFFANIVVVSRARQFLMSQNTLQSTSSESSQSVNGDLSTKISRNVLNIHAFETSYESKNAKQSPKSHIFYKQVVSCSSSPQVIEKKAMAGEGNSSNLRQATVFDSKADTSATSLRSPSKKCYGAPDLSKDRNVEADFKKSLADLRRVTKFSMVSQWFATKITHCIMGLM